MTLEPFYAAPLFVKAHIVAASVVAALTPLQFWSFRKGSFWHRVSGYSWLMAMVAVAATSFLIETKFRLNLFGFSLIHVLSVFTLAMIPLAFIYARVGNLRGHRFTVIGMATGFWIAGAFTLLPPRIMHAIVFG
jgi:uncharacterized membrane protein